MPFLRPISDRYFEDYVEGDVHHFGTIAVGADEIVAFPPSSLTHRRCIQIPRRPRAAPSAALSPADGTPPAS